MVELEQTFTHSANILVQQVNGTVVLLSSDTGQYYTLDEVGGRAWALCDGTRSVAEIIKVMCDEYDAPPETISSDVLELLGELAGEKILV